MESSALKLWGSAQQLLRTMLNAEIYNLWFAPVRAVGVNSEVLTLEVPNDFSGVWLQENYRDLITDAIGQYIVQHKKTLRVTYLSTEKFTNEFIDAIQNNNLARFRKRYRQTDVFLIDDIQFLASKERIQEEFFHTFNALHEQRKQIVMPCDRTASEIQNLEARLVSRFEWGLVTDMQPPDVETRLAILRKKGKLMGVELADDI